MLVTSQSGKKYVTLTLHIHREPAKHLVYIAVSVPNWKKVDINFFENLTIDQTLQICEDISVFALSEVYEIQIAIGGANNLKEIKAGDLYI
jgi:hypothetical protein